MGGCHGKFPHHCAVRAQRHLPGTRNDSPTFEGIAGWLSYRIINPASTTKTLGVGFDRGGGVFMLGACALLMSSLLTVVMPSGLGRDSFRYLGRTVPGLSWGGGAR